MTRRSRGYAEMALNIGKNPISQCPRLVDVTRAQRKTQALRSGIRFVYRHMTPPYATVVPQMMILIIIVDSQCYMCLLTCHDLLYLTGSVQPIGFTRSNGHPTRNERSIFSLRFLKTRSQPS